MQEINAKPLAPALLEMDGISKRQIEEHYTLYQGYVNKTNEVRSKLESADRSKANQTFSDLRELKVELSFAWNGVKLHELYFENLGGKGGQPAGKVLAALEANFGSFDKYIEDLKASGIAARGWVVTALDEDGKIYNYVADSHNSYGIWKATPLVVLDTYEHAYVIDYGVKRPPYIDAFLKNLSWEPVAERLGKAGR
ncbi:MAG: Fe-Mn family superoxide dismutase [Chloroflexi bacterium]|nr:Fe-Mn family superoxide dismutase [Chloroflexota bacterium]